MYSKERYTPASEFELASYGGEGYAITKYTGNRTTVVIPPMIRGRKVMAIKSYAFTEVTLGGFFKFEYHSIVEKVIIPETVHDIMDSAFEKCNTLRTVIAHPGVEHIGSRCFFGCDNLMILDFGMGNTIPGMVKLPKGLKKLEERSLEKSNYECIFREVLMSRKTKWKGSVISSTADAFNAETCAVFYYEDGIPDRNPHADTSDASQQYTPENEFELVSDGDNYVISKYTGDQKVVSVPPMIRGRKVVAVGNRAFCREEQISFGKSENFSTVEKVTLPETVTKIDGAFQNCTKLHTVIAHPGIEEIGPHSFFECYNLTVLDFGMGDAAPGVVKLPKDLKSLGEKSLDKYIYRRIFTGCIFREVLMSRKTRWKGSSFKGTKDAFNAATCAVFYYEDGIPGEDLRAYEPADSQQYTPESEFELLSEGSNYAIKSYIGNRAVVSIPPVIRGRKVVKLGCWHSFVEDKMTLEKVIIPETVTEIGARAFQNCEKLHTVIAHPGITVIDDWAFECCVNLKNLDFGMGEPYPGTVMLPKGLKKLGYHSLVVDLWSNKCLFEEVIAPRGLKVKDAFNVESCRIFYYED